MFKRYMIYIVRWMDVKIGDAISAPILFVESYCLFLIPADLLSG